MPNKSCGPEKMSDQQEEVKTSMTKRNQRKLALLGNNKLGCVLVIVLPWVLKGAVRDMSHTLLLRQSPSLSGGRKQSKGFNSLHSTAQALSLTSHCISISLYPTLLREIFTCKISLLYYLGDLELELPML